MATNIFVNLPTADLPKAKEFYAALGAQIVPEFTDDNAACVKWDDNVFFMVLTREYFATFTDRPVHDPRAGAQVITALSRDSREEVDAIRDAALAAGGSQNGDAKDYGFMYQVSLNDPDGNILEFLWMDPVAAEKGPEAYAAEQAGA